MAMAMAMAMATATATACMYVCMRVFTGNNKRILYSVQYTVYKILLYMYVCMYVCLKCTCIIVPHCYMHIITVLIQT